MRISVLVCIQNSPANKIRRYVLGHIKSCHNMTGHSITVYLWGSKQPQAHIKMQQKSGDNTT